MENTKLINRRSFLKTSGLIAASLSITGCDTGPMFSQSKSKQSTPNIVFILADDMGIDSVSALNSKSGIETPCLNKLMTESMTFTDAHSGSAVCSPTRYGVLTGRYSWRTRMKNGIVGKWERPLIDKDRLTVGKMLQQCGYDTACIGKWHLGWNWLDSNGKPTGKLKEIDFTKPVKGGPTERGFDYCFGDDVPNWPPFVWIENDRMPFIAKWPGVITPGSKCDEVITIVDFMATAAEVTGYDLPDNAAEDSFSLVSAFRQQKRKEPIRPAVICHSSNGYFAVRKGKYKVEFCAGSGGWSSPKEKQAKELELPPVQLYDLKADPKEQNNLADKKPAIVEELRAIIKEYVEYGRSTPGPPQRNEGPKHWKQLPW